MALTQVQGGMLAGSTNTTTTIQSNGTTAITIDSSQKVGIGTTTPTTNLQVRGAGSGTFGAYNDPLNVKGSDYTLLYVNGTNGVAATIYDYNSSNGWYVGTNNSAGYRIGYMSSIDQTGVSNAKDGSVGITINTNGRVLFGSTDTNPAVNNNPGVAINANADNNYYVGTIQASATGNTALFLNRGADDGNTASFRRSGTTVGTISVTTSSTSYNTSSDYRLKENIAPMTGALAVVGQLKPCIYTWKADGSAGQGFIAHELAEVVPQAVNGKKDAVDADGNPEYQGVDTSFLVATLTAAIQELNAKVEAQAAEIAALKAVK